jgi:hypothetical protein
MFKLIITTISAIVLSAGCKPQVASDLSLVNGKLDDQGLFPSVVQTAVKIGQTANGFAEAKCTASVISSRVVLTAAHCVTVDDKNPTQAINGELLVDQGGFGQQDPFTNQFALTAGGSKMAASSADVIVEGKRITGGRVAIHPAYLTGNGPDVAVLVFPEGTFKDFKHMAVASGKESYPRAGLEVMIVGFGKTDQFDETSGGEKRYGKNRLIKVGNTLDFNGQTQTTTADGTNVFNSQGDSGGPMISNEGPTKGQIIGVSSTQNTVSVGDTTGEGHYANLLEESTELFLSEYVGEGKEIDLPEISNSQRQADAEGDDRFDRGAGSQFDSSNPDSGINDSPDSFDSNRRGQDSLVRPQGGGCVCPPSYAGSPSTQYRSHYGQPFYRN